MKKSFLVVLSAMIFMLNVPVVSASNSSTDEHSTPTIILQDSSGSSTPTIILEESSDVEGMFVVNYERDGTTSSQIQPRIDQYVNYSPKSYGLNYVMEVTPLLSETIEITVSALSSNISEIRVLICKDSYTGEPVYGDYENLGEDDVVTCDVPGNLLGFETYRIGIQVTAGSVSVSNPGTVSLYVKTI